MEKESKDLFFVEVMEPEGVKRNILESLKDIVENLQRFEKFKKTRKEKINKIKKLGITIKDLNKLVADLKSVLPQAKVRAAKVKKGKTQRRSAPKAEEQKKKPMTELQKLEFELGEIENKLGSLR